MTDWAQWLLHQRAEGRSCWAYFNNDIHGHALEDARALKAAIADGATEARFGQSLPAGAFGDSPPS
jgi:uncharacterized protein YecE (DUF72 family)